MKKEEINIRDPYILLHEETYYLYGTRSKTCWGKADGFDCYTSNDLENWEGPFEIFHRSDDFWADENFWAPECVYENGWFYLITTLGAKERGLGVYSLRSESPLGPFSPWSEKSLTPEGKNCIDGTIFIDDKGKKWLFYSYDFPNSTEGVLCVSEISEDFSKAIGEPIWIAEAKEAPWSVSIPFSHNAFGQEEAYFSDGPCLFYGRDEKLYTLISSWGKNGYAVGLLQSKSGEVSGPWEHLQEPLYGENGGHGMVFETKEGKRFLTLHFPNDKEREHPIFIPLEM
jgi:beta-xylosidase